MHPNLSKKAQEYLHRLCVEIPHRAVGSDGNRAATLLFTSVMASFGYEVESTPFGCIDWAEKGARLVAGEETFVVHPSPYSLGCRIRAPLSVVSRVEELESASIEGNVLLLYGDITKEQLMPKNFPFYNPEEHQRIINILEFKKPGAIITATAMDLDMVGAIYPFPLLEDGDFEIPSVYTTDKEGNKLAEYADKLIRLESHAKRKPANGYQVVARKGIYSDRKVVLFAHIDTRLGTPGANDNASGVITLLLLAELMESYEGNLGIEIVAMNGEDYYAASGEKIWVAENEGLFNRILLGINLDDVGYHRGKIAYSLYGCPPQIETAINQAFSFSEDLIQGEPWYQGDHGLFLINQVPALAVTSDQMVEMMREITHTPKDTPDLVDPKKMLTLAKALKELLLTLDNHKI